MWVELQHPDGRWRPAVVTSVAGWWPRLQGWRYEVCLHPRSPRLAKLGTHTSAGVGPLAPGMEVVARWVEPSGQLSAWQEATVVSLTRECVRLLPVRREEEGEEDEDGEAVPGEPYWAPLDPASVRCVLLRSCPPPPPPSADSGGWSSPRVRRVA